MEPGAQGKEVFLRANVLDPVCMTSVYAYLEFCVDAHDVPLLLSKILWRENIKNKILQKHGYFEKYDSSSTFYNL